MLQFLRNLLGGPQTPPAPTNEGSGAEEINPGALAQMAGREQDQAESRVRPEESIAELYDEFCRTFFIRPGVTLMDQLREQRNTQLLKWLHWNTLEPEPKAFIRLALECTRSGMSVWSREKVEWYIEGLPANDGGPSPASEEGLALLCKATGSAFDIFYTSRASGEIQFVTMEPTGE
jgi:hypothetical protein